MNNRSIVWIFFSLFGLWVYMFPYAWWSQWKASSKSAIVFESESDGRSSPMAGVLNSGLQKVIRINSAQASQGQNEVVGALVDPAGELDVARPALDEIKVCLKSEAVGDVTVGSGGFPVLLNDLVQQLGPTTENILLEREANLQMSDGHSRKVVYEWISKDEGVDLYWHETDKDGFPIPVDLPNWATKDMGSFNRLLNEGAVKGTKDSRLMVLNNKFHLGIDRNNERIETITLKSPEGRLIRCRTDVQRAFVCECP